MKKQWFVIGLAALVLCVAELASAQSFSRIRTHPRFSHTRFANRVPRHPQQHISRRPPAQVVSAPASSGCSSCMQKKLNQQRYVFVWQPEDGVSDPVLEIRRTQAPDQVQKTGYQRVNFEGPFDTDSEARTVLERIRQDTAMEVLESAEEDDDAEEEDAEQ